MDLKELKVKSITPYGANRVDHLIRTRLGLNVQEYCIFHLIYERKMKNKDTHFMDIELHTGFTPEEINTCIEKMQNISLLAYKYDKFYLNKKMVDNALKERLNEYEQEFELFWKETVVVNGKEKKINAWPGPKEDALNKFKIARKKYSFDFIMNQRKDYFKYLKTQSWRQKMQATKFLNVKTGQIAEDFKSQIPEIYRENTTNQKLTKEEKDKLFK